MFYFFVCLAALVLGYMTYGAVVDRILAPDEKAVTPAYSMRDDVDYVPMPKWKLLLIQVLDIAGIGPIFGPILGALYGPAALLWIVIGSIFAGAVHDYMSGMLSVRNKGASIPELVGEYMGMPARQVMRVFSVILLMLVGVVFVLAPAKLLTGLTGVATPIFVAAIFAYYFLATILPIDKVIGRFYPALGGLLLVMTVSIAIALMASDHPILPNMDFFTNVHPKNLPLWPLLFVTLSCGAISGFHSTQSPLMARCVKNEREGRMVFYGAMIIEGVIALVWATIGLSFYDSSAALGAVVAAGSPAAVVKEASNVLLGPVGGALAVLAVIILPITSGDTAFRSTRLIVAETFKVNQAKAAKRLFIAVPMFVIGFLISQSPFESIWRYFGFSNQMLSMLVLWSGAVYLAKTGRFHWICTVPATFMTAVCASFIILSDLGFSMSMNASVIGGVAAAVIALGAFMLKYGFGKAATAEDAAK
jgi:carbon starvation protein CstA